nr:hypothetical protein [Rossellomorea marisflavi]
MSGVLPLSILGEAELLFGGNESFDFTGPLRKPLLYFSPPEDYPIGFFNGTDDVGVIFILPGFL